MAEEQEKKKPSTAVGCISIVLVLGVIYGIVTAVSGSKSEPVVVGGDSKQGEVKQVETKQPVAKQEEPAMKVTAKEVAAKYKENEIAGDQMYKNKKLEISGKIESIDSTMFDGVAIKLAGVDMFQSVMCNLEDAEKSKAAQLKKGADITLLCVGSGEVIGSATMKDCTIK